MEKLGVLVFGAGAIGTYVGGSLALAGHRVTFIEQPAAAAELAQRGLVLDLTNDRGRWTTDSPSSAVHRPSSTCFASSLEDALARGPFDVGIFALKSFDTAAAVEGMRPYADRLPPILCLSNGVDNEPALAAVLGPDKVIAGTVTSSVGRRAIGDIVLERLRGVGVADGHPLSLALVVAMDEAHLNPRLYPRPADMKWSKMLTNLMVNASAAILDMPPRQVLADRRLFGLEIAMLREALAVMRAQGIRVVDTPQTPVRLLALATSLPTFISRPLMVKAVGGGRGGKMPSFHIDLHSGRGRSEVEWLNGAVVRYGEQRGIRAPVNRALNDTLLGLTRGEIPLTEFSGRPERLLEAVSSAKQERRAPSGKA
jgi:2-dehydropantoate 2-reductase